MTKLDNFFPRKAGREKSQPPNRLAGLKHKLQKIVATSGLMPGMANKFQGGRIQLSPQPLRAIQPPAGLSTATTVCIGKHTVSLDADELELVCELGRGAYGDVHKMREKKTGAELAVKRIR